MHRIFGLFRLTPDSGSLICQDYELSHEKDRSSWELGFYHNSLGLIDTASSEEVSEAVLMECSEKMENLCLDVEFAVLVS